MATYVIGDVQGCFKALKLLLKSIQFNKSKDRLVFCGDLVNRGGQSLKVLRWVYKHKDICDVVLGNHDLSLIAQYYVPKLRKRNKEFVKIFKVRDCDVLMKWLIEQELILEMKIYNAVIVHAGVYPKWSLKRAKKEADFALNLLRKNPKKFCKKLYGNKPSHWRKSSLGMDRARFAINCFTRMRFLFKNSGVNISAKGKLSSFKKLVPWFEYQPKKKIKQKIIFGHWSALSLHQTEDVICIDTGKVWGGQLTAAKLTKSKKNNRIKLKNIFQV